MGLYSSILYTGNNAIIALFPVIQNVSGTKSRRQVVSLQSFDLFNVISKVLFNK